MTMSSACGAAKAMRRRTKAFQRRADDSFGSALIAAPQGWAAGAWDDPPPVRLSARTCGRSTQNMSTTGGLRCLMRHLNLECCIVEIIARSLWLYGGHAKYTGAIHIADPRCRLLWLPGRVTLPPTPLRTPGCRVRWPGFFWAAFVPSAAANCPRRPRFPGVSALFGLDARPL